MTPAIGRKLGLCGAAIAACLSGCEPRYLYRPSENATAQIGGHVAADYPIPSPRPTGDVRIAAYGVAELPVEARPAGARPARALHLRLVVFNNSPRPWTIDAREQRVDVRGVGQLRPTFARSDHRGLPTLAVPAASRATIDLYFALPSAADRARAIPEFDALWRLDAGGQRVVERTPFERLKIVPYYASATAIPATYVVPDPFTWVQTPAPAGPTTWNSYVWTPGGIIYPGWIF
jgi:hypothetical protein